MEQVVFSDEDIVEYNIDMAREFLLKADTSLDKPRRYKSLIMANRLIEKSLELMNKK